jgi:hypothetical protein
MNREMNQDPIQFGVISSEFGDKRNYSEHRTLNYELMVCSVRRRLVSPTMHPMISEGRCDSMVASIRTLILFLIHLLLHPFSFLVNPS